jgi:predicted Zn-dependent protease
MVRWSLVLGLVLATGAAWRVYPTVKQRYLEQKQERALVRARDFLNNGKIENAKLELAIALTAVPGNPAAVRLAADLLDRAGSAQALTLRRSLVEADPASVSDRIAMSATALRLKDFNAAREALRGLTAASVDDPAVLRANLNFALAADQRPVADMLFDRMEALGQKTDEVEALHAFLLRLHPSPEKAAAARAQLETLAANPDFALAIHRTLYADAIMLKDFDGAKRHAALACEHPKAAFADRLNEANLALIVEKQPFQTVFERVAPGATRDSATAAEFARWMFVQGKSAEAGRWLAELPEKFAQSEVIQALRADRALVAKNWDELSALLSAGAWGNLAPAVIESAFAARAMAAAGREATARNPVWATAVTAAGMDRRTLVALLRLTRAWGWVEETEQLLWVIVRGDSNQAWAHTALMEEFRRRGDGAKMLDLVTILKAAAPESVTYRHDWTVLTLLAAPTAKWDVAKDAARELALAQPKNSTYAVTFALALAQSGRVAEAREVVERLPPAEREHPPRAPYLAYIYGLSRRPVELGKFEAIARPLDLLKEERRLIAVGRYFNQGPAPATGAAGTEAAKTAPAS